MEIPKEPKRYTTVYGNFKGVDFTNDPTNVYRLRSPDGLNMTPDMDGNPRKRHGWEVTATPADYKEAFKRPLSGTDMYIDVNEEPYTSSWLIDAEGGRGFDPLYNFIVGTYDSGVYADGAGEHYGEIWRWDSDLNTGVIYRENIVEKSTSLRYCEIGGTDFILIFNSYGLFIYSDIPDFLGWTLRLVSTTPFKPERSFFYEGQGTAGYYVWDGLDLYRFGGFDSSNNIIFSQVTPYKPITHIACTPTLTSATTYESVNMLTAYRRVQYMGDGSTVTFYTPTIASYLYTVERLVNGKWSLVPFKETADGNPSWKGHKNGDNELDGIVFSDYTPPASTEDNIRITYESADRTVSVNTETVTRPYQIAKLSGTAPQYRVMAQYTRKNGETKGIISGSTTITSYTVSSSSKLVFDTSNIHAANGSLQYTVQYNNNGTATALSKSYRTVSFGSYNSKCNVTVGQALYNSTTYTVPTADSETYSYGSWNNYLALSLKTDTSSDRTAARNKLEQYGMTSSQVTSVFNDLYYGTRITCYVYKRTVTKRKKYEIRVRYTKEVVKTTGLTVAPVRDAFASATRSMIYGNGLISQIFIGAVGEGTYKNRIWYSGIGAEDFEGAPTYFPDLNYMEVGSNDTAIMGMMKVGEYLGVIKQGSTMDSSVYLAYPTSFNEDTAYAVKQKVAGVGAVSNGAFNILNDEPLFLSKEGVMAIVPSENEEKQLKNRSYYINKKLLAEQGLETAVSFVYKNMYLLGINNKVYVLDGAQKTSWANEKTNLQYECYYWDNVPASCFAKMDNELYFSDLQGNLCRFKTDEDSYPWYDAYPVEEGYTDRTDIVNYDDYALTVTKDDALLNDTCGATVTDNDFWKEADDNVYMFKGYYSVPTLSDVYEDPNEEYTGDWLYLGSGEKIVPSNTGAWKIKGTYDPDTQTKVVGGGDHVDEKYMWNGEEYYLVQPVWQLHHSGSATVYNVNLADYGISITRTVWHISVNAVQIWIQKTYTSTITGCPIHTRWSTIADDDGMPHYFKNLQKKGTMVILTPSSDSGVEVSLKADNKDPIGLGEVDVHSEELPFDVYTKKKVKKYKRLQFICENDGMRDSFGVDKIIKQYTVGNYSKNR